MASIFLPTPGTRLIVSVALAVGAISGCQKAEQIHSYTVPKETKVSVSTTSEEKSGEPTDRMLAAILPSGDQAWFFKTVGPIPEIDKHEKEIKGFFTGLTLNDNGKAHWKLPAGWKEEAGGNEMRLATIVIPADKRLELTVAVTPWSGTEQSMLANVNRWRGQMQLPAINAHELGAVTTEAKAGDRPITIVDLKGRFKSGGMTAPFAGGPFTAAGRPPKNTTSGLPAGHPSIEDANSGLPAGHPPIESNGPKATSSPPAQASSDAPKFVAPPSWKSLGENGMHKAELAVGDGQQQALVTFIEFPVNEGPMISDPLMNINMWRRDIGLDEIKKDDLGKTTESITIDSRPATFAAIIPDAKKQEESQAAKAILAAIVRDGDRLWFIKMKGNRNLVAAKQDEFKAFLKSVKFPNRGEAGHGNK
jgi:hypothetical protein